MKSWLRRKLVRFIVKDLFNLVDGEDILRVDTRGGIIFRGQVLPKEEVEAIKRDAAHFRDSFLWKALTNEVKYIANKRMFEKSQTLDDILAGKLLLYILDVLENKIKQLSNR